MNEIIYFSSEMPAHAQPLFGLNHFDINEIFADMRNA